MRSNAFERINGIKDEVEVLNFPAPPVKKATRSYDITVDKKLKIPADDIDTGNDAVNLFHIHVDERGIYRFSAEVTAEETQMAWVQLPVTVLVNEEIKGAYSINVDLRDYVEVHGDFDCTVLMDNYVKFNFERKGIKVRNAKFELISE